MSGLEPWMLHDEAAWWAKLRRAGQHRDELAEQVKAFNASEPYTLTPEDTDDPEEVAYRLRIVKPVPADLVVVIGDLLHNLRSALDSLAFALAAQSVGRDLTGDEERATEFPVCATPDAFAGFFGEGRRPTRSQRTRGYLYDRRSRRSLRAGQPFYLVEQLPRATDEERDGHFRDNYRWSTERRLWHLSNIDKHRRLPVLGVGWPDLVYFGSNEEDNTVFRWGQVFFPPRDDTILGYLRGPKARQTVLTFEAAVILADDPAYAVEPGEPIHPEDGFKFLDRSVQAVGNTIQTVLSAYASNTD